MPGATVLFVVPEARNDVKAGQNGWRAGVVKLQSPIITLEHTE